MTLATVPGVGTMSEVRLTCEVCGETADTVRDVVPAGWIEVREIGGYEAWGPPKAQRAIPLHHYCPRHAPARR